MWTCTLAGDVTFDDGTALDAGDVLASVVAAWDATGPIRAAAPDGAFADLGRAVRRTRRGGRLSPAPEPGSRAPGYFSRTRCMRIACSTSGPICRRASA